jgi:hypothetical protein
MKDIQLKDDYPEPKNKLGYTVKESQIILNLKPSQINNLFKSFGIKKTLNTYYASLSQLNEIKYRKNRSIKEYDL